MRATCLTERDEPNCVKSRMLTADPNLAWLKTDSPEPNSATCRTDIVLPMWQKSSMLVEEPKRAWLKTDKAEPSRP